MDTDKDKFKMPVDIRLYPPKFMSITMSGLYY